MFYGFPQLFMLPSKQIIYNSNYIKLQLFKYCSTICCSGRVRAPIFLFKASDFQIELPQCCYFSGCILGDTVFWDFQRETTSEIFLKLFAGNSPYISVYIVINLSGKHVCFPDKLITIGETVIYKIRTEFQLRKKHWLIALKYLWENRGIRS